MEMFVILGTVCILCFNGRVSEMCVGVLANSHPSFWERVCMAGYLDREAALMLPTRPTVSLRRVGKEKRNNQSYEKWCPHVWTLTYTDTPTWWLPRTDWAFHVQSCYKSNNDNNTGVNQNRDKLRWPTLLEVRLSHIYHSARRCIQTNTPTPLTVNTSGLVKFASPAKPESHAPTQPNPALTHHSRKLSVSVCDQRSEVFPKWHQHFW